jgi:hypothetical protein
MILTVLSKTKRKRISKWREMLIMIKTISKSKK